MQPPPSSGEHPLRPARSESEGRWAVLDVVVKVSMPILMGVSAWAGMMVLDHESRLDVIEATRYTQANAASDRKDGEAERQAIVVALAELKILVGQLRDANVASAKASERAASETAAKLAKIEDRLK